MTKYFKAMAPYRAARDMVRLPQRWSYDTEVRVPVMPGSFQLTCKTYLDPKRTSGATGLAEAFAGFDRKRGHLRPAPGLWAATSPRTNVKGALDWDQSFQAWDPATPIAYLFPYDFFLETQNYLRAALANQPAPDAPAFERVQWTIDVLARCNEALLATNLHPAVLSRALGFQLLAALDGESVEGADVNVPGSNRNVPLFGYFAGTQDAAAAVGGALSKASPLRTASQHHIGGWGFDLMALPAVMSSETMALLAGPQSLPGYDATFEDKAVAGLAGRGTDCAIDSLSFQRLIETPTVQFQPWMEGGWNDALATMQPARWLTSWDDTFESANDETRRLLRDLLWWQSPSFYISARLLKSGKRELRKDKDGIWFTPMQLKELLLDAADTTPRVVPYRDKGEYRPNFAWVYKFGVAAWAQQVISLDYARFIGFALTNAWFPNVPGGYLAPCGAEWNYANATNAGATTVQSVGDFAPVVAGLAAGLATGTGPIGVGLGVIASVMGVLTAQSAAKAERRRIRRRLLASTRVLDTPLIRNYADPRFNVRNTTISTRVDLVSCDDKQDQAADPATSNTVNYLRQSMATVWKSLNMYVAERNNARKRTQEAAELRKTVRQTVARNQSRNTALLAPSSPAAPILVTQPRDENTHDFKLLGAAAVGIAATLWVTLRKRRGLQR
jgi:hypothetical protein